VPVEKAVITHPKKLIVKLSIFILLHRVMLEQDHFLSKIDRNVTLLVLMHGVAVGWASTHYGTGTPARACRMVVLAGSTWMGYGHEWQEYFHFQSILFHFRSDSAGSQDSCATCALSPTHPTHIMSRPGHHLCTLWNYSYEPRSFGTPPHPSKTAFQVSYLRSQRRNQAVICTVYAPRLIHYCV
jgi:hypothetical protein